MNLADRIERWRGENHDKETEYHEDLLVEAGEHIRDLERRLEAAEGLLERNEGRVKEIVDEHLVVRADAAEQRASTAEGLLTSGQALLRGHQATAAAAEERCSELEGLLRQLEAYLKRTRPVGGKHTHPNACAVHDAHLDDIRAALAPDSAPPAQATLRDVLEHELDRDEEEGTPSGTEPAFAEQRAQGTITMDELTERLETESREQMLDDFARRGDDRKAYADGAELAAAVHRRADRVGAVAALGIWIGFTGCYELYTRPGDGEDFNGAMQALCRGEVLRSTSTGDSDAG